MQSSNRKLNPMLHQLGDNPPCRITWTNTPKLLLVVLAILATSSLPCALAAGEPELINVNGNLEGIGYREQELQIAKGT